MPEVYSELKRLAAHHLKNENPNHPLKPTDLVHETYLQLRKQHSLVLEDRVYFFSIASTIMRRILVNSAKYRMRKKRGDGVPVISLESLPEMKLGNHFVMYIDVLALEDAMNALARHDPRKLKIVELHFYGGLTFGEIASFLGLSRSTVMRQWRDSRKWLSDYLNIRKS
jgi:RNA polymerase sigma factor (TIGR02999 family)